MRLATVQEMREEKQEEVHFLITLSDRAVTLTHEAAGIINKCKAVKVQNDTQRGNILELVKQIKTVSKNLEAERMATTRPMDDAKKQIMDLYWGPLDNLTKAESTIKGAVIAYDNEKRRQAAELQRKLQAEADAKARKERERLEAKAQKAMEAGKVEKAEALHEQAEEVQVFVPIVETLVAKTAGVSTRKVWKHKIVDVSKLPRKYMIPNEAMLAALAKSTQGNIPVAGVEFYQEDILAVRR